ncbi:type II toxin-antitoxin system MqsA family antitoxin [Sulfuricurvum sp.]|uniref:type II toxin-antitoxin system MqsA family antitoxin n=1 Tax=Sulfuricurvum sp. TaxID=2025608 RepID=UPI00262FB48D|nr:type II toxin-antitoxin system MqsA family antitoxin [Sulfuricurvum sp.]MDD3598150.1 type II toxin-antitoxin system MqsA family antitoxin [Sulfuricurvum sp.]
MKCVICKHGETQQGSTTVTLEKNGSTIVFKHVPAHVCDNCGEKYVDDTVTAELLKKAQEIIKNGVEVDIREFQSAA